MSQPAANVIARLAEALETRPVLSAWMGIPEPMVAGLLAREAFDAVTMDMQHSGITLTDIARALPLVHLAGKPLVARVPVGDFATASRLIDLGASAVIAPMINSVDDARRFAAFMKYPPVGERSWGPGSALPVSGQTADDYFNTANRTCLSFAMVETREALAIVDDILAVEGIDGVFVGPADLSIALSGGKAPAPASRETTDAIAHVAKRCADKGKKVAAFAHTAARAKEFVGMGVHFVSIESDSTFLRSGARAALAVVNG